jgi:large subunit ribosomal protein L25
MEVGKLTVQRRTHTGKGVARKLRAQGKVPGVCYGFNLEGPLAIAVDLRALKASLDPTKRQNTVIDMTIEDNGQSHSMVVMVREYQIDPIRRELTHVDLVAIDTEKEVVASVPIEFAGKAKGLVLGGQLHVVRHEIDVRCKPTSIPSRVIVDISDLDIGGTIHISDLKLPEGISAATPGRLTIITMAAPEGGGEAEGPAEAGKADAKAKGKGKDAKPKAKGDKK